jgi:ketosteroid isomerase-like protein
MKQASRKSTFDAPPHAPARDPQDLERLLVARQRVGDVEGMMALYEPQAVVDCGDGTVLHGTDAIRAYFAGTVAAGRKFAVGEQRPAVIGGDLALTSTRLPDGAVTAESLPGPRSEVARRQADGTWRWIIDTFVNP